MTGGGGIYSPWNDQPLTERHASPNAAPDAVEGADLRPVNNSPKSAAETQADLEAAPALPGPPGAAFNSGAAEAATAARRPSGAPPERVGDSPLAREAKINIAGLTIEPEALGHVEISEAALLALNLIATAHGESLGAAAARAAAYYVNEELNGFRGGADIREGQGQ